MGVEVGVGWKIGLGTLRWRDEGSRNWVVVSRIFRGIMRTAEEVGEEARFVVSLPGLLHGCLVSAGEAEESHYRRVGFGVCSLLDMMEAEKSKELVEETWWRV